ncbi:MULTISPECIES: FAD binding domain-containing protein [unclassified Modestobacter]|uniref:FAD binding domain-containing protein n=1 Tax=unclassified Modestobacter TaxID=2643866 RepID=UPI0022AAACB4|nr:MULTISPECIES: FAD binding domain-containing protein [unclassified Modestobacter]MCZ2824226.1 FAD binding domain-containing protein [Modestobacter sp. VKM Ac-2981]MCZ2854246.1 FAD binding domain-containing protein [Modestobacter sp. VKM Ac-2982]
MIPARFRHVAPADLGGCVAALAEGGRVLAGGTWVLPEMSRGESAPAQLVDLRRAGLAELTATADGLQMGAMCTYADLLGSGPVAEHAPLLRTMAGGITGGWALRNQATVGGAAMAARPQSDVPAALVACAAVARVAGPRGARDIPAAELFAGAMRPSLAPDEVLAGFRVPSAAGAGSGYVKLKRGGSSWPIATAAAVVRLDAVGLCTEATLVLGGVAAVPVRIDVSALLGRVVVDDDVRAVTAAVADALPEPWGDVLAPASYRAAVAAPVARRALSAAVADAEEERA